MQSILREKLMMQAYKLAEVSNIYRTESQRFVEVYFNWLEEAEKDLSSLRSPISILLQSEKSSLLSVMDGSMPSNVQEGKSIRKYQRVVAAQSLEKVSREIYAKIENIDSAFEQIDEKLCHTIAVLGSKEPGLYDRLEISQQGIALVRGMIRNTAETAPMYNYLSAKLSSVDIDYILTDIIKKIESNKIDIK